MNVIKEKMYTNVDVQLWYKYYSEGYVGGVKHDARDI